MREILLKYKIIKFYRIYIFIVYFMILSKHNRFNEIINK